MYSIRDAKIDDIPDILRLINSLCVELWNIHTTMTKEKLENDVFCENSIEHIILAQNTDGKAIGFLSWEKSYDWHHGVWGASLTDLFILKPHRGSGLVIKMIAWFCDDILQNGGIFFRTLTADDGFAQKMGARFGMENKGIQYTIANKALAQIAKMKHASKHELKALYPSIEDNSIPIDKNRTTI